MLLRLDKGDVHEVLNEFCDQEVRVLIQEKILKLFNERVSSIVEETIKKLDIEKAVNNAIKNSLKEYLKQDYWGKSPELDRIIKEKLNEEDIKKYIEQKMTEELLDQFKGRLHFTYMK